MYCMKIMYQDFNSTRQFTCQMKEILSLCSSKKTVTSPSGVLQLADTLFTRGEVTEAVQLIESNSIDLTVLNADHLALLVRFYILVTVLQFALYFMSR